MEPVQCFFQVLHAHSLVPFGAGDAVVACHVLNFNNVLFLYPKADHRTSNMQQVFEPGVFLSQSFVQVADQLFDARTSSRAHDQFTVWVL